MGTLFDPALSPFLVSLYVLAGLVALNLAMLLLGADLFHFVDDLLPDLGDAHVGIGDIDHDVDLPHGDGFAVGKALAFVGIGKLPVVMVLMTFLAMFGLSGYFIQIAVKTLAGSFAPLYLAVPPALVISLLLTGRYAAVLSRLLPSEETTAVSAESLIGNRADVVWGDATFTRPATAKTFDRYGKPHHIQVKASAPEEIIHEGQGAVIVSRASGFYIATTETGPSA